MTRVLVLHVLPLDLPRGAQRYARAMRDALSADELEHRTLAIFESEARALDADVKLNVPQSWAFRRGFEPRAVIALRRAIRELEPRLLVAHGSQPLKYLAAAAPHAPQVVYYKIGIVHDRAKRPPRREIHSLLLRRAARIAAVSQECLDEAQHVFGAPTHKLVLIPNGRDPSVFFPDESREGIEPPRLLFVGYFGSTKRPERFVELVARLRSAAVPFHATMVGDGPLLESLRARAEALSIELLGRRDDVPELMRRSSALLFTSQPDGEGMPGVFIEAGLSGLPIVTTAVPGASTVVRDGEGGYVVPVDDFEALLERTRRLLLDGALRKRFGEAARRRCLDEFTLEQSARRWSSLAQELVSGASAAPRSAGRPLDWQESP